VTAALATAEAAPKERPILFSAPMVLALLAGRKTQTRRIMKSQWPHDQREDHHALASELRHCPYGQVGERLWVKETWRACSSLDDLAPSLLDRSCQVEYVADGARRAERLSFEPGKTRVSIFMPRWASRLTLEITEVRVQRLQEISVEDAKAEGLAQITKDGQLWKWGIPDRDGLPGTDDLGWPWVEWNADPRAAYARLWDLINGDRPGAAWADSPWVWAVTFRRVTP
jgi:hypothetical protein